MKNHSNTPAGSVRQMRAGGRVKAACQPGGMGAGNGPHAEQDDQHGSGYPHRTAPQQGGQTMGQQAGRHQRRQGAQAEGRHQRSGQPRLALAAGPDQGAVDQPAGQPAPERTQQHRLGHSGDRQQSACHGLDMLPHTAPQPLQAGQAGPPVGQIQPHGNHQQTGQGAQQRTQSQILNQPTDTPEQGAGDAVAGDAAHVIAQQDPPQGPAAALLRGNGHGQRAHEATAHADTMTAAEQAQSQGGEEERNQFHRQCGSSGGLRRGMVASGSAGSSDGGSGSSSSNRMLWAGPSRSSYWPLLTAQLNTRMAMATSTMATGTRM